MTLVYIGVGWFVGLALAAVCPLKWPVWLGLSLLPIAAALLQSRHQPQWRLYLALAFIFLGATRYRAGRPRFRPADLATYNGRGWGEFEGYVAAEPDPRADHTRLTVAVGWMQLENDVPRQVSGRALLKAPRLRFARAAYHYGDRLRFSGRLQMPAEDDDFSYRDYLARKRIYTIVQQPRIELLPGRGGSPIKRVLFDLKAHAQTVVRQIVPDPEASLLSGILLGNEQGIPASLMDDFSATGATHIIVISGFNISIIINLLFNGLEQLVRPLPAGLLTIAAIAAYTILVGADPAVVRAAVMGSLLTAGRLLRRKPFGPASLMAAAMGMTAVEPLLLWDIGFQLSFAATLGLMLYAEPFQQIALNELAKRMKPDQAKWVAKRLGNFVFLTLAAQLATMPLIAFHFGQTSSVSLLTNLLILWAQPFLMIFGGAATVAGLLWLLPGRWLGWLSYPFLWWTIRVVRWTANLPIAAIESPLSPAGLALIYALLVGFAWLLFHPTVLGKWWRALTGRLELKISLGSAALSLFVAINFIRFLPDGRLHVTFLKVGEGEAILIRTPAGRRALVDGGPDPAVLLSHLGRRRFFWDHSLDLVIATHPDSAHVNGLPAVLEHYRVGALITSGEVDGPPAWGEMLVLAEEKELPQVTAVRGQTIHMGDGVVLEVLHPGGRLGERRDDNSVVLRLSYGNAAFLLTGDAGAEVEAELIEVGMPLQSIVLKAADGGDRDGTSQPFLEAVNPWVVLFSVGDARCNPYRHPHPKVLERLEGRSCPTGRTDQLGSIHFITDGQRLWVETEK